MHTSPASYFDRFLTTGKSRRSYRKKSTVSYSQNFTFQKTILQYVRLEYVDNCLNDVKILFCFERINDVCFYANNS